MNLPVTSAPNLPLGAARIAPGLPLTSPLVVALLLALAIALGAWLRYLLGVMERETDATKQRQREVNQLPIEEVERRARIMLEDPEWFAVTRVVDADYPRRADLGPAAQRLFDRYASISGQETPLELHRTSFGPSLRAGYLRLGETGEQTEVAVLLGGDEVVVLAEDVPAEQQIEERFPTIFHYLLASAGC